MIQRFIVVWMMISIWSLFVSISSSLLKSSKLTIEQRESWVFVSMASAFGAVLSFLTKVIIEALW
jgi:hypothetical protein